MKQRSDAIFCSDNCRVQHHQHQKELKKQIDPLLSLLQGHDIKLAHLQKKQQKGEDQAFEMNIDLAAVQGAIIDREDLLSLSDEAFRVQIAKVKNVEEQYPELDFGVWQAWLNTSQDIMHGRYYKALISKELPPYNSRQRHGKQKLPSTRSK